MRFGSLDVLIAAHDASLDGTLVTANVDVFARVPQLRVESWIVDNRSIA